MMLFCCLLACLFDCLLLCLCCLLASWLGRFWICMLRVCFVIKLYLCLFILVVLRSSCCFTLHCLSACSLLRVVCLLVNYFVCLFVCLCSVLFVFWAVGLCGAGLAFRHRPWWGYCVCFLSGLLCWWPAPELFGFGLVGSFMLFAIVAICKHTHIHVHYLYTWMYIRVYV